MLFMPNIYSVICMEFNGFTKLFYIWKTLMVYYMISKGILMYIMVAHNMKFFLTL